MSTTNQEMTLSDGARALRACLNAGLSSFIWGPPGIGKSDMVREEAKRIGDLIDVRAALLDPVDLRGLPEITNGRTSWSTPDFLPTEGSGILFLDELNLAPQAVQSACYQLILDRRLGDYVLPDGWTCVAAGNRTTDKAGVQRMSSALANRFANHINVTADLDSWCSWAFSHDIKTELIAFLRFRPELLHRFDPNQDDKTYPTPRSWSFVSRLLETDDIKGLEHTIISNCVGAGASAEFVGFLKVFEKMPSIDAILLNPKKERVPENDPATMYAVASALSRKATIENFEAVVTYLGRMPPEFSVLSVKDAVELNEELKQTGAFIKWAADHQSVML